jgi:predicted O-methyltransferase YrrM
VPDRDSRILEQLRAVGAAIPGSADSVVWPVVLDADPALGLSLQAHSDGLRRLATELVSLHTRMTGEGHKIAFGDGEGGVLYALIRALQPSLVFEVSPASGWSTNYILATLTDNSRGELHSFEIEEHIGGLQTEVAIRRNLVASAEQSRLTVHIGDAMETTQSVEGVIDLILLDSCHETFFADWYTRHLLPRVQGVAMIQDVHFWDRPEQSGEAYCVLDWAARANGRLLSVGALERAFPTDGGAPARWPNPSNAVLAHVDGRRLSEVNASPVVLAENGRLDEALRCTPQTAASLVRICQLAAGRDPEVLAEAASCLAELAEAVPVVEVARALSAAGLHEQAVAAARAVIAARPSSLPVRVGAAEALVAGGRSDEASRLLGREALVDDGSFALAYRYLWRAADIVGERDRGWSRQLEQDAFRRRSRARADEEKFFSDYLGRVRSRGVRARDIARIAGDAQGRRSLFRLIRQRVRAVTRRS